MPELARARRLDVVMRVEQNGRSAGRCADLSEDRGHAFDLDDLRITARASQDLLRGRGGSSELRRVVSRMTDGRDAHEGLEVGTKLGHEFRNTVAQRSYGRLGLHGGARRLLSRPKERL